MGGSMVEKPQNLFVTVTELSREAIIKIMIARTVANIRTGRNLKEKIKMTANWTSQAVTVL